MAKITMATGMNQFTPETTVKPIHARKFPTYKGLRHHANAP